MVASWGEQDEVMMMDMESTSPGHGPLVSKPAFQGCRSVDGFSLLNKIDEGSYGIVYKAQDRITGEVVALKQLKIQEGTGFPITALREISILLRTHHANVVNIREVVVGGSYDDQIFLCLDFAEHDLSSLRDTLKVQQQSFTLGEVKCLLVQLLRAVAYLHSNWIFHRDLKTSNLLLDHNGILKVADFGLAREYEPAKRTYTPGVVTLWYRAPELLLGTKEYSAAIDMWSVGCIFGELLTLEPMFKGESETNQLNLILETLGTPKVWPDYFPTSILTNVIFKACPFNRLMIRYNMLCEQGLDLLNKFLLYSPEDRETAVDALTHSFFKEDPLPLDPSFFPKWPAKSEISLLSEAIQIFNEEVSTGFFLGDGGQRPPIGAGFTLKF